MVYEGVQVLSVHLSQGSTISHQFLPIQILLLSIWKEGFVHVTLHELRSIVRPINLSFGLIAQSLRDIYFQQMVILSEKSTCDSTINQARLAD